MHLPGCFGKLPAAPDFIGHNAAEPLGLAFQEWLQAGVTEGNLRLGDRWSEMFSAMPPQHFIYWSGRPEPCMIGTMVAGQDTAGRRFPFATWVQVSVRTLSAQFSSIPVAYAGYLRAAGSVDADPSAIAPAVEAIAPTAPATVAGYDPALLADQTTTSFAASLGGGTEVVETVAVNLANAARRVVAVAAGVPAYGFRFPLPADGLLFQPAVAFWLELMRRCLRNPRILPICLWSSAVDGRPGSLDVHFRSPGGLALLHRIDPSLDTDGLYPLNEGQVAGADAVSERIRAGARLTEVLDAVGPA